MDHEQQTRGQSARRQNLLALGLIAGLGFLIIVVCGYGLGWKWTGIHKKTFWDWLDLLIVPVVLAIGGYLFTRSENQGTQAAAERRAQDEALQAYLDQMGQLLLDKERPLRQTNDAAVRTLARARTLTVLTRLGGVRKGSVVRFLYESDLITKDHSVLVLREVDLTYADLRDTSLSGADLSGADLSGANLSGAYLRDTNLSGANLGGAYLYGTDLREANLSGVNLINANLRSGDLIGADLSGADLGGAYLYGTDLREANLDQTKLFGADLRGADLSRAEGWTDEQLRAASSFTAATMPDGQKYEDWLKDRESRKEDG
jgi:uncharacterized protein YjbI with pentapeptide repeats